MASSNSGKGRVLPEDDLDDVQDPHDELGASDNGGSSSYDDDTDGSFDGDDDGDDDGGGSRGGGAARRCELWRQFIDDEAEQSDDDIDGDDLDGDGEEDFGGFFVDDDEVESEPEYFGGIDPIEAAHRKQEAKLQRRRDRADRHARKEAARGAKRQRELDAGPAHRHLVTADTRRTTAAVDRALVAARFLAVPTGTDPRRIKRARSAEPVLSSEVDGGALLLSPGRLKALPGALGPRALPAPKKSARKKDAGPDLKLHHKRLKRRLLEANLGKVPNHRAGRAVFLELEQYTPLPKDLEVAMPLVLALMKVKKTSASHKFRAHAKRIYKYWKVIASGKPATLTRRCTKEQAKKVAKAVKVKSKMPLGKARAGANVPTSRNSAHGRGSTARPPHRRDARSAAPASLSRGPKSGPNTRVKSGTAPVAASRHRDDRSLAAHRRSGHAASRAAKPLPKASPQPKSVLGQVTTVEFRHHWPGLHRKITLALDEKPPNVERALVSLRKLKAAKPTRSMLEDAIKGGLVADIKAFRKHSDPRVASACTELYTTYKAFMT